MTPAVYFGTALEMLAGGGHAGFRLGELCRRVGVTTGSFYHHFEGWTGFVGRLLEHWEAEQTARVVEMANLAADPYGRIAVLKRLAIGLPHAAEAAIRNWSGVDPQVRQAQQRVDALRTQALSNVIAGVVDDPVAAQQLAILGLSILVGWQQLRAPSPTDELGRLLDDFEVLILRHAQRRAVTPRTD